MVAFPVSTQLCLFQTESSRCIRLSKMVFIFRKRIFCELQDERIKEEERKIERKADDANVNRA